MSCTCRHTYGVRGNHWLHPPPGSLAVSAAELTARSQVVAVWRHWIAVCSWMRSKAASTATATAVTPTPRWRRVAARRLTRIS